MGDLEGWDGGWGWGAKVSYLHGSDTNEDICGPIRGVEPLTNGLRGSANSEFKLGPPSEQILCSTD